jgi:DNA modification methylase
MNTGRGFIGIEREEPYFRIAKSRIEAAMPIPEWLK